MSEIWREELRRVATAHGLREESLEDWFALREPGAAEPASLAPVLGAYLEKLADLVGEAAAGSAAAIGAAREASADLAAIARIFELPGLEALAKSVAGKHGHLRLSREAADLLAGLASALRVRNDVHLLRERDGEWATLPLAALPETGVEPETPPAEVPASPGGQATRPPVAARRTTLSLSSEASIPSRPGPSRSALVVGARSIGREFLVRQLLEAQLRVQAADNPFEAERALARQDYDLVLVDAGAGTVAEMRRLAGRRNAAAPIAFLVEESGLASRRILESIGPVLNRPPSQEEIEALLNRQR